MATRTPIPAELWPSRPEFFAMPESLKAKAVWHVFESGSLLFALGAVPTSMFFVTEGEVRLRRFSPDGSEIILQRSHGNFLAEASIEAARYHCDAIAVMPATVIQFPIRAFRQALETGREFRACWTSHLLREVRRSRAQCERLALKTVAERIGHFIECESLDGRLVLSMSRKAWAAELGVSHEALYRTLARMEDEGLIEVDGQTITRLR